MLLRLLTRHSPLFKYSSNSRISSIHFKILETNRWQDLMQLFTIQQQDFTPDVIMGTAKHMVSLISKDYKPYQISQMKPIVEAFSLMDMKQLQPRNIINILTVLRNFTYKGYHIEMLNSIRNRLCNRYFQTFHSKQLGQVDVGELLFGYHEMIYFKDKSICVQIVKHLLYFTSQQIQNLSVFTTTQLGFLLHLYAMKGSLTKSQIKLRSYVLTCVISKLSTLRMSEIVKIAISLNRMQSWDMSISNHDSYHVKLIGEKILEGIHQLEEKSIRQFLRGQNYNKNPIFKKIYHEFVRNVFAEIEEDGSCEMDRSSILNILVMLSDNMPFKQITPKNCQKYHQFLRKHLQIIKSQGNQREISKFHHQLTTLINNDYFQWKTSQDMVQLIKMTEQTPSLQLLEAMYNHKIDLSPFIQAFIENKQFSSNNASTLRMAILLNRVYNDPRYLSYKQIIQPSLQNINKKITQNYLSLETFTWAYQHLIKDNKIIWVLVQKYFSEQFASLPNPLELEGGQYSQNVVYLDYVVNSFKHHDFIAFMKKNQKNIKPIYFKRVIQKNILKDNREIQFNTNLLQLANNQLPLLLQANNKFAIGTIIELLSCYCRFAVLQILDNRGSILISKLMHAMLSQIDSLKQSQNGFLLAQLIQRYLQGKYRNYHNQNFYLEILKHSLKNVQQFSQYRRLIQTIIEQSLRRNIITAEQLKGIDVEKLKINYFVKCRLNYILDNSFSPSIRGINNKSLLVFLTNPNLMTLIEKQQTKIIKIINQLHTDDAGNLLSCISLPLNQTTKNILKALTQRLIDNPIALQKIDLCSTVNNLIERYNHKEPTFKLIQKIQEIAKDKMKSFSAQTHRTLIGAFVSQGINPSNYYEELLTWGKEKFSDRDLDHIIFALRQTDFDIPLPILLDRMPNFIKKDFARGVLLFMIYEQKFQESTRNKYMELIVEQINLKQKIYFNSKMRYDHLCRHYPTIMSKILKTPEVFDKTTCTFVPRKQIKNILEDIASHHGVKLEINENLSDGNPYVRIKDWVLIFSHYKLQKLSYEQRLTKKMVAEELQIQGFKGNLISMRASKPIHLVNFLHKSHSELLPQELNKSLVEKINQVKAKRQSAKEE